MSIDVVTWAPEVQMCIALLAVLWYGTGPAIVSVAEGWWMPIHYFSNEKSLYNQEETKETRVVAGPGPVTGHLSWWTVVWCLLSALLVYFSPFYSLQAGGLFVRDFFTVCLSSLLFVYAGLALAVSVHWLKVAKVIHSEYLILIMLAILGQHLLLMTNDLMALYLCLELQSFSLVVLCSLNYTSAYAVEAGMKYFLLSAFSSCLLLLGVGLIYYRTGLTRCAHLTELLGSSDSVDLALWLGLWLVSLALLWKLAAAPLHFWAADVYQGAWSSISLLISTLPKISVLGFWIHHWSSLWNNSFSNVLGLFSAMSLVIGAVLPLAQVQLKRLMAFSSVGHMGFLLMPLALGAEGISSILVYLVLYLLSSLAVWGLLLWPYGRANTTAAGPQYVWDLARLNLSYPAAGLAWTLSMLSLAGLPPAAGFLGKLAVFWTSLNAHMYVLVFIALVATLLSRVYYLRVLKVIYVDAPINWGYFNQLNPVRSYLIAGSSLCLAFFLWHGSPLVLASHLLSVSCSFLKNSNSLTYHLFFC